MRTWLALAMLVAGIAVGVLGGYLIAYRAVTEDPRFGEIYDPGAGLLGLFLLIVGLASI